MPVTYGSQQPGHPLYCGYNERLVARNSRFYAAKEQGHAFKCYSRIKDIRGCYFAPWDTLADRDGVFRGELPPVDLGAWGHTVFMDNIVIRRGIPGVGVRQTTVELRNRIYTQDIYQPDPSFGTLEFDYRAVDNRNDDDPMLFRHFFGNNLFVNGLNPDGSLDPTVVKSPGTCIRNNGAQFWSGGNSPKPGRVPDDWQPHNERSVLYTMNNEVVGVPYKTFVDTKPYETNSGGPTPHRIVAPVQPPTPPSVWQPPAWIDAI